MNKKYASTILAFLLTIGIGIFTLVAQAQGNYKYYADIEEQSISKQYERRIIPLKYTTVKFSFQDFKNHVSRAPRIENVTAQNSNFFVSIPLPDGKEEIFSIVKNRLVPDAMKRDFPEIMTFDGQGVYQKGYVLKLDVTYKGIHAMIMTPDEGLFFMDPYAEGDKENYIVYRKSDFVTTKTQNCGVDAAMEADAIFQNGSTTMSRVMQGDCNLRTYRLALAATGEYTSYHGGTKALAQSAQTTTMNRVNGMFERDVAVTMIFVANNANVIYTNAGSDPYANTSGDLNANQTTCDGVIGSANYDIGHLFGTGGGGIAQLNSPCTSTGKARGLTGSSAPVGDPFDIDYVAHEMGHQFGGTHTFNSTSGSCSGNRSSGTAYEPGSGTSIMAYAGICSPNNVQNNSDSFFYNGSIAQMKTNIMTGNSSTCDVMTTNGNQNPVATAGSDYTIPYSTPFELVGSATDPNGNTLSYAWEEHDLEATSSEPPTATDTDGPLFRSFNPVSSPRRYMPKIADIRANTSTTGFNNTTWEVLPSVARTIGMRLTVRDNVASQGCTHEDNMVVTVNGTAGPFIVTAPNTALTWAGNSTQNVTWNVAGTTAAPVSCANVNILLSTDGGNTYPTTIASNVPNTGTASITVPNTASTTARIRVQCANNIFFDISNVNFTITASAAQDFSIDATPTPQSVCQGSNTSYTINTVSFNGFNSPVTLSVTGLPAGATASFVTNPITPTASTTMNITTTGAVTPGTYSLTITGVGVSLTRTKIVSLVVVSSAPAAVTLSAPANGATGVSLTPSYSWTAASGATSYTINVATDAAFTTIVETANPATNSYTSGITLSPNTTYYWRVRAVNNCGNSAYSTVFSFTTANTVCNTYASTNVPVTIPTTVTTVTSTLTITDNITISDINVSNLVGSHTWISDLIITLTSPTGTNVVLMNQVCNNQDNFNIKYDDAAASATIPCPPVDGLYYRPNGLLSSFNGQSSLGTWTLTVQDVGSGDGGSLTGWSLYICGSLCTAPTITGTTPGSRCGTGTVTLGATASAGTINWYAAATGGASLGTGTSFTTPSIATTTTYYVSATSSGCTTPTRTAVTATVTPNVTPSVSIALTAGTNPTCTGNSVTFTATPTNGGTTPAYQWKVNGANVGTNSPTYTTTTLTNGQIVTCVLTSNATCASPTTATSNAITMTVNAAVTPSVSIALTSGTNPTCAGNSVTFTATPTNGGLTPSYQWKVNGANVGTNSPTYTTTTLTNGQIVTCVLTSNATCASPTTATSNAITMTVNAAVTPSVSIALTAGTNPTCSGNSVTFTATPTNGGTTPAYQWKVNGANVGTNSPTYTTTTLTNGQIVTCVLTSNAACATTTTATSNAITMTVNTSVTPSVSIAITAGSNPTCSGNSVTFTATPTNGGTTPAYQWKVNGANVGTNSATYTSSTLTNGQIVTCVLTSNAACATTTTATSNAITMTLSATVTPGVSISVTSGTNPSCTGSSVTFTATPSNGGATPSYQWKLNGSNVGTNSATYTNTTLVSGDIVTCVMTSSSTCASPTTATSNAITMTVNAAVTPSVSIALTAGTNPTCSGGSATFTATPTNGGTTPAYQWKVNGANVGTNSPTYTTTTLTNGQIVTCVLTSNAACATTTTATSNVITMTVNASVTPSVSIALTAGTNPTCSGSSVTFTATPTNGGTTPSYQWKRNGANVGTNSPTYTTTTLTNGQIVTCVLTSNAACATTTTATSNAITMTVNATVTPSVSIALTSGTNPTCSGNSVTFTATPTNGGTTPAYQWKVNGANVGTNSPTYTTTTLTNGQIVTCVLTSNAACATTTTATSNAITMTVNTTVTPSVSIALSAGTNPTCSGGSVTFTATPTNGGTTPVYQWKVNGANVGTNSTTYTTTALTNGQIVTCVLTSNAACATTTTATSNAITMTVNGTLTPSVAIAITSGANPTCSGSSVTFTATPTNGGATPSYQWKRNGTNVGTNSPTYTTTTLTNGQIVTCVMTSSSSCASPTTATSNAITMTVNANVTPSVSIALTSGTNPTCSGGSVTFTATATNGGTTPAYQWKVNGSNVGTNSVTYTNAALVNGDIVTCVLTSNAACATTTTATSNAISMTVNASVTPTVSIALTSGTNPTCAGGSVTFTATATNGGTTPAYQWKVNGANVGTNSTTYTSSTLTNGQVVTCVLTSNAACASATTATSNAVTMTINNATASTLTQIACGSYTLNSQTYTSSGTYTQTLTNAAGCDSIITLNLAINNATASTLTQTACGSYTLNSQTYTSSGTYTQTLSNAAGCDSIITLNLTINNATAFTLTQTACGSYTLNSQTYTSSGTYTQTISNAIGCDSTITLNLIINNATASTLTQAACGSYTLNSQTYTSSGTYTQTITNSAGCDSIITLNLTINQATTFTQNITLCFGESITVGSSTYNADGTYTDVVTGNNGCDSTITTNLTVLPQIDITTSTSGSTITANQAGATYQWIDCNNGNSAISGETNQSFTATASGNYAVILNNGVCADTSACVTITGVKTDYSNMIAQISVYPNPSTGTIKITAGIQKVTLTLVDMLGRELYKNTVVNNQEINLDLPSAAYWVEITNDEGMKLYRDKLILTK